MLSMSMIKKLPKKPRRMHDLMYVYVFVGEDLDGKMSGIAFKQTTATR